MGESSRSAHADLAAAYSYVDWTAAEEEAAPPTYQQFNPCANGASYAAGRAHVDSAPEYPPPTHAPAFNGPYRESQAVWLAKRRSLERNEWGKFLFAGHRYERLDGLLASSSYRWEVFVDYHPDYPPWWQVLAVTEFMEFLAGVHALLLLFKDSVKAFGLEYHWRRFLSATERTHDAQLWKGVWSRNFADSAPKEKTPPLRDNVQPFHVLGQHASFPSLVLYIDAALRERGVPNQEVASRWDDLLNAFLRQIDVAPWDVSSEERKLREVLQDQWDTPVVPDFGEETAGALTKRRWTGSQMLWEIFPPAW